jgi:transcriptional regulator GlxA family with amidase domain
LRWLDEHIDGELTLERIAEHATMSTRTLNRRFREQVGATPMQWLRTIRIRRAHHLLEATDHPIERVARMVGFGSATAYRSHFTALVGTNPRTYRQTFRSGRDPEGQRSGPQPGRISSAAG